MDCRWYCWTHDQANTSLRDNDALQEKPDPKRERFGFTAQIIDSPKVSEVWITSALAAALQNWLQKANKPPQILSHFGQSYSHFSLQPTVLPLLNFAPMIKQMALFEGRCNLDNRAALNSHISCPHLTLKFSVIHPISSTDCPNRRVCFYWKKLPYTKY